MASFLIAIIVLALVFDYINGFHDAANSIATVVSTKVLTPFQAVLWAALFNFVAFFIFKDHGVADTIAKTVKKDFVTLEVIFSGLVAAIIWNLFTLSGICLPGGEVFPLLPRIRSSVDSLARRWYIPAVFNRSTQGPLSRSPCSSSSHR